jgi:hypothetical protein
MRGIHGNRRSSERRTGEVLDLPGNGCTLKSALRREKTRERLDLQVNQFSIVERKIVTLIQKVKWK